MLLLPPALPAVGVVTASSLAEILLTIPPELLMPLSATEQTVVLLQGSILPSDLSRLYAAKADLDRAVVGPDRFTEDNLTALGKKLAAIILNAKAQEPGADTIWSSFQCLMGALLMKDATTFWHSLRVAQRLLGFAVYLGEVSDGPKDARERVELLMGAALHDIGKWGITNKILTNEKRLSPEEWRLMRAHPSLGYMICHYLQFSPEILSMILYHHEQWGGEGYPFGLQFEEIPFWAQLASVVDVYDAKISSRPYRPGVTPQRALMDLRAKVDSGQFDPDLLGRFIDYHEGLF